MPARCVCAGCGNFKNVKEGISLYTIPFYGNEKPEAKRRRKRWVQFVKQKRAKWEPSKTSVVCSKHFNQEEDFTRLFTGAEGSEGSEEGLEEGDIMERSLKRDRLGFTVFPTIHTVGKDKPNTAKPPSDRERRMVR